MFELVSRSWRKNRQPVVFLIVAVIVVLCLLIYVRIVNADLIEKYRIQLKTRSFIPPIDRSAIPLKINVQTSDRVHAIMQFNDPLTYLQKQALLSSGVVLLEYLPDQAWFASVPRTLDENDPVLAPLRWIDTIPASDRVDPDWLASMGGTDSLNPDGTVKSSVKFFADVSTSTIYFTVSTLGGYVESYSPVADRYIISLPPTVYSLLYELDQVQYVNYFELPVVPDNDHSRHWANTNPVHDMNIFGSGVNAGIWDEALVATGHPDLYGRVTIGEPLYPRKYKTLSQHSTHVAGTIAGNGANSANVGGAPFQWRGHAPTAKVFSYAYSGPDGTAAWDEMAQAVDKGIDVANVSMGNYVGWEWIGGAWKWKGDDYPQALFGKYSSSAPPTDKVIYEEGLFIAQSAGNHRDDGRVDVANQPPDWDQGLNKKGYDTIQPISTGKNIMCVGATDGNNMSAFSDWGPTDDGRIKPDVVAHGVNVRSTFPYDTAFRFWPYQFLSGTSMATPVVTGSAALLIGRFQQKYPYVFKQYNGLANFADWNAYGKESDFAFGEPQYQAQSFLAPVSGQLDGFKVEASLFKSVGDLASGWRFYLVRDNNGKPGDFINNSLDTQVLITDSFLAEIKVFDIFLPKGPYLKMGDRYWIVGQRLGKGGTMAASLRTGPDKYKDGDLIWSADGVNWKSETSANMNDASVEDYNPGFSAPDMDLYFELRFRKRPLPSTLKALFINTATDLGRPGPDYQYGWGLINNKAAIDAIDGKEVVEAMIGDKSDPSQIPPGWVVKNIPGEIDEYQISVASGTPVLKVTLAWDDKPAAENAAKVLINDLDLYLIGPDGNKYFPWTLNPQQPEDTATMTKADTINNVEQVYVKDPKAGLWKAEVDGSKINVFENHRNNTFAFNSQSYSLAGIGTKLAEKNTPIGGVGGILLTGDPADPSSAIIPPGAVNQEFYGSVSSVPAPAQPPAGLLAAGKAYEFGPTGMEFNKNLPVTLTLKYDPKFSPSSVDVFNFNPNSNSWEKITAGKKVDPGNYTISVKADHFSIFMPMSSSPLTGVSKIFLLLLAAGSLSAGTLLIGFGKVMSSGRQSPTANIL